MSSKTGPQSSKKLVFSVTAKDCDFKYTRGSGAGGQHRNKTSSACRCTHRLSGASGFAQEDRHQRKNRENAFRRMTQDPKFQQWLRLEYARRTGELEQIERRIEREIENPKITKVEVKYDDEPWREWSDEDDRFTAGTIPEESPETPI